MTRRRSIDRKTRFEVLNESGFRCRYCGRGAPDVVLEVDHLLAVSQGGSSRKENLGAACFDCNRGKRTRALVAIPQRLDPIPDELRRCGDGCPYCPVEAVATLPVAVSVTDGSYVMTYRCRRGHQWQTWVERECARVVAEASVTEQVECWPCG